MQVQLLESLRGPGGNHNAGDIINVDDDAGQRMIAKNIAIAVEQPKPKRRAKKPAQSEE